MLDNQSPNPASLKNQRGPCAEHYLILALRQSVTGYHIYLPAVVLSWALLEGLAPLLIYDVRLGQVLLFPLCLVLYAATAQYLRSSSPALLHLYGRGLRSIMDYYWLQLLALVLTAVLVWLLRRSLDIPTETYANGVMVVVLLLLATRLWPVIALPFLPVELPRGLSGAWRLTRTTSHWPVSFTVVVCTVIALSIYAGLLHWGTASSLPGALLHGVLYALILPVLSSLALNAAHCLGATQP